MPNGGTDNCMNCTHNRANSFAGDVKSVRNELRADFCQVHKAPIPSRAWTYCQNTYLAAPDRTLPINTIGLQQNGYQRIPWYGLTRPVVGRPISSCSVCNAKTTKGIKIPADSARPAIEFCSNEHYLEWHALNTPKSALSEIDDGGRNALHRAVIDQDCDAVNSLCSKQEVNKQDLQGWTPLHYGCLLGNPDIVELLLKNGATANVPSVSSQPYPTDIAASEGHRDLLELLIPITYSTNSEKERGLLAACTKGNLLIVEALIKAGVNIESRDERGLTPLLHAVNEAHLTIATYLLDQGANILVEDNFGNTPLSIVTTWKTAGMAEMRVLVQAWLAKH